MSIFKDQSEFMLLGGQLTRGIHFEDRLEQQLNTYAALIEEEAEEFETAYWYSGTEEDKVKESVDVIVVAAGWLVTKLGHEGAQKAWNAVHESNLSKVQGKVEKRADGKILKSDAYKKAAKAEMMAKLEALL